MVHQPDSPFPALDRRRVLAGCAATALVFMTGTAEALASAQEQTRIINTTAIAVRDASAPWEFDLFYDMSRYITARSGLDGQVARLHFEQFRKEKWGWANSARIYALFRKALSEGVPSIPEFLASGQLSDHDQWFAQHILDAWYHGIYRYDGKVLRVTYEDALMWEAVNDLVPVQGLSDAEYGYWSKRPPIGDRL